MNISVNRNIFIPPILWAYLATFFSLQVLQLKAGQPYPFRSCLADEGVKSAMQVLVERSGESDKQSTTREWQAFSIELAARDLVSQLRRYKEYYGEASFIVARPEIELILRKAIVTVNALAPYSTSGRLTHAQRIRGFCETLGIKVLTDSDVAAIADR